MGKIRSLDSSINRCLDLPTLQNSLDDLAFVRYRDFALSPDTTQVLNARDASVKLLRAWYPAGD